MAPTSAIAAVRPYVNPPAPSPPPRPFPCPENVEVVGESTELAWEKGEVPETVEARLASVAGEILMVGEGSLPGETRLCGVVGRALGYAC